MKSVTKEFENLIKNNIRYVDEPNGYCLMQNKHLPPDALESKLEKVKAFAEKVHGELIVTKQAYIRGDKRCITFTLTGDVVDMKVLDALICNAVKAQINKSVPVKER